jgi:hypothetical protein
MAGPRPWTVLPHGPLERLEENLWAVSGALPRGAMNRRMAVVRLGDGRLVFHNAVPLREPAMRELEAWGTPAVLFVPNRFHRLDLHGWKARYPALRVACPERARPFVSKVVPVDAALALVGGDPALEAVPLDGSRWGEVALLVRSGGGARASLVFADTLMNVPHQAGAGGLVLRLLGTSGGPKVTRVARLFTVSDAAALATHLRRLAATPGLTRLVVSHGEDVTRDPAGVLRGVAAGLA